MELVRWTGEDLAALQAAAELLEGRSFAMNVAARVGMPVESLMRMLPNGAQHSIGTAVNKALEQCLKVALGFGAGRIATRGSNRRHTWTTAATGALGGFFGLPGLLVELPVTTTVMLHSIAEIARSQGENLSNPDATRAALAQVTRDAAAYVAQKGLVKEGAPVLLSFLSKIAARFGLEVSEKAAAQLIPVAGAAGGLALNVMFMRHFQRIAEGHFTVRRLERKYGADAVRHEYEALRGGLAG
jgi:hypothetical protein